MANKRIKGGARLRDVAAAAGVSKSTASAVANGRAEQYGISHATRERVQAAIRQMGYAPSLAALDMVAGRNTLVGLAISADFPAAALRLAVLEPLLAQAGCRVILTCLPSEPQAAADRIAALIHFGVAGMVICPADSLTLPKFSCPAVMVGKSGVGFPAVYEDELEGGRRLARRLLDKGHRRIAILGGTVTPSPVGTGFLEACAQVGATIRSFNSVAEFLPTASTMTAVFCLTPAVLLELYSRGCAAGLRPGTDLAVVAVDPLGVAANLVPRPTVLQPGIARLGQAVVQLLQQVIQGATLGDIRLDPVIFDGDPITPFSPSIPVASPPVATPNPASVPPPQAPSPVIIPNTHKPVILPSESIQMPETVVSTPAIQVSAVVAADPGGTDPEPSIPVSGVVAAVPGGTAHQSPTPIADPVVTTPPASTIAPEIQVPPLAPEPAIPEPVAVIEPAPPPPTPEPPTIVPTQEVAPIAEPVPQMEGGALSPPAPEPVIPEPVVVIEPEPTPPTPEPPTIVPTQEVAPIAEPVPQMEGGALSPPAPDPVIPEPVAVIEPAPPTPEPPIIVPPPETPPSEVSTPDEAPSPSLTAEVAPEPPTPGLSAS